MSKLSNENMKNLLGLQKIGNFSNLTQLSLTTAQNLKTTSANKGKVINKTSRKQDHCLNNGSNEKKVVFKNSSTPLQSVSNPLRSVSTPLAGPLRSVSTPLADPLRSVSNPLAGPLRSVSNPLADPLANSSTNPLNNLSPEKQIFDTKMDGYLTLLTGKEFIIIRHIYFLCKEKCCLVTPPVSSQKLLEITGVKPNHLRNLISRLTNKRLVTVVSFKSSKQAARVFELTKYIYEKLGTLFSITFNSDPLADPLATPLASPLYVSSKYIKPTTYEEEKKISNLPPEWSYIDYSVLEAYGFDEARLIQIHREYKNNEHVSLTPDIIQNSINHFAYDLEHNGIESKFRSPPVAVLTSMLKKGNPYSSITPSKVLSPQEAAMLKYRESQNIANTKIIALDEELQKTELSNWLKSFSGDELLNQFYEPSKLTQIGNDKIRKVLAHREAEENAKTYFAKEIWPSKKQEILSGASEASKQ